MKKKRKIVRYRKRFHINIGVIIFVFILVYFLDVYKRQVSCKARNFNVTAKNPGCRID